VTKSAFFVVELLQWVIEY